MSTCYDNALLTTHRHTNLLVEELIELWSTEQNVDMSWQNLANDKNLKGYELHGSLSYTWIFIFWSNQETLHSSCDLFHTWSWGTYFSDKWEYISPMGALLRNLGPDATKTDVFIKHIILNRVLLVVSGRFSSLLKKTTWILLRNWSILQE